MGRIGHAAITVVLSVAALSAASVSAVAAPLIDAGGSAASTAATSTVAQPAPPIVTQNPTSVVACDGGSATFTAAAVGDPPVSSVQWQVEGPGASTFTNDTTDAGATTDTLTVSAAVVVLNGTRYQAVFTNAAGSTTTSPASVTVLAPPPPFIVGQPTSQTVTAPAPATFTGSVEFSSICGALSAQWQVSSDGGAIFTNVGASEVLSEQTSTAATSYVTGPTAVAQSGDWFRFVLAGQGTSQTSSAVKLTVIAPAVAVTRLSPAKGADFSLVLVSGKGFRQAREVDFGAGHRALFLVLTDSLIAALAPAQPSGVVDVAVRSSQGTSLASPADQFTYGG